MASRISRSITKQTAKMKALMNEFNTLVPANENISWEQVTDLSSSFWLGNDNSELAIPRTVRLQAINSLSKLHRASEEVHMLDEEMINVVLFHFHDYKLLRNAISSINSISCFTSGSVCLLKHRLAYCEEELKACVNAFDVYFDSIVTFIRENGYISDDDGQILHTVCNHNNKERLTLICEPNELTNFDMSKKFYGNRNDSSGSTLVVGSNLEVQDNEELEEPSMYTWTHATDDSASDEIHGSRSDDEGT